MRFFAALLRSSSALWIGPLAVALAVWYANRESEFAPFEPYLVARTAAGADPLFLVLAVVAACAAWEGGRLRRAGWIGLPNARPFLVALAPLLAPPMVAGIVAIVAGLEWKLRIADVGVVPDLRFIVPFLAITMALILFGFAIGMRIPPVVAAPAMLIGVYAWMVLPITVNDPVWLRHLTGNELGTCCSLDSDIAARALIAPVLMAAGIAGAALTLLLTQWLNVWRQVSFAAGFVFLGAFSSAAMAQSLPHDPIVPRSPSLLICAEGTPRVCVWPEHDHLLASASTESASAVAAWSQYGIEAPVAYTEASPDVAPAGSRSFGTWQGADRVDLLRAFALTRYPESEWRW